MGEQGKKPEETRPGVLTLMPRAPPKKQEPPTPPLVFRRTKRMKFNRPDGASFEIDCPSVDFKSQEMPWQVIYLENGDEIWWRLHITEIFDTLQVIDGDPTYLVKHAGIQMKVVPLGGSRTPGIPQGTGEHIDTLHRQGPGDADEGG